MAAVGDQAQVAVALMSTAMKNAEKRRGGCGVVGCREPGLSTNSDLSSTPGSVRVDFSEDSRSAKPRGHTDAVDYHRRTEPRCPRT
ncbi:hypothetical protein CesoFtcFv8_023342 [Champsocephalus esox]|uniref:Uncharacterized protein n=2 Tax=Champsocephalus TaxID=52236 RepID=A0AAN8CHG3_CHAGU|nr:hypothetical protein CesoFtcFv8_023342 [Champsocephalus esox]KAK5903777.1 hypothetical protein CgunFtcFv8_007527 [Champsocephalus gunnari]